MTAARRFRFGVQFNGATLDEWLETARQAEDLGFDMLMSSDHFGRQMSPMLPMVACAAVTTRLRFGTIVLDNDFRHPAVLAKEASTVDVITGGRFELGLGAGWSPDDYRKSGIAFAPAPERMQRLGETVAICRAFFAPEAEAVSYEGRFHHIDGLDAYPRPMQPNGPPIMVGGRQKRMLSLAARIADIVSISLLDRSRADTSTPPPSFLDKVAWIRDAAGERYNDLELQVNAFGLEVTDDATGALQRIAERAGVTTEQALESPANVVGSIDSVVEQLQGWRERGDVSYFNVPARSMRNIAPVVARLAGK
jgi:probable F420-dependent oxidoreductase